MKKTKNEWIKEVKIKDRNKEWKRTKQRIN